jgi:hypothetical protein
MNGKSRIFRSRAIVCEQRAREATDPIRKREWEELAAQWHSMADLAAATNDEASEDQLS